MKYLFGFALLLGVLDVGVTATASEGLHFVSVTAGADHVCALTDSGAAYCWGSNESGQLGSGSADSVPRTKPVRVGGDMTFATLAAGFTHTCGLTRDGVVFCWGANDSAQLGDGTVKNSPTPVRVATDVKFKTIGPGGTHTCAVSVDGIGYCWGGNWHGQLGVADRDGDAAAPCCYRVPTRIRTDLRFSSVVAGGIDSCGVAVNGKAITAGGNVFVATPGDAKTWGFTCGLTMDNAIILCWGDNRHGALGNGSTDRSLTPVRVVDP